MDHRISRRGALVMGAGAVAGAAFGGIGLGIRAARAQAVARTARVIVGFPAGGSSDVVARLYAERLRGAFAPQAIVENRTGAAGRIAVETVKAAEADGTTILQTPASMLTLQPHVFPREVRYDPLTDLVPVSTVCTFPFAWAVPMGHPARTLQEFADWARSQQGEVPFASPAAGAAPHFMGIQLAKTLGIRLTHVPYRGAAPAVQDVVAGRLPGFMGVLGDVSPQHGTGLRMLALSSAERNPRYPEVPTFAELGFPALTNEEWFGMLVPANTPARVVDALHQAVVAAAATEEMRAALERMDYAAVTSPSPQDFAERIRRELEGWGPIVRESGFEPEN